MSNAVSYSYEVTQDVCAGAWYFVVREYINNRPSALHHRSGLYRSKLDADTHAIVWMFEAHGQASRF